MSASPGESESLVRDVLLRDGATLRLQSPTPAAGADVLVGAFGDPDLGSVDSCHAVATELDRFGGAAALDRQALRELILRFALLMRELPEVVEADLNPVRCTTNGCAVLDMRVRIERRRPINRVKTW